MNALLLGFDVLGKPEQMGRRVWDNGDREKYLLRPEIKFPVSVDRAICPSIFQPSAHQERDATEANTNLMGLWRDAASMARWIEQRPQLKELVRLSVAIQLAAPNNGDPMWDTIAAEGTSPAAPLRQWERFGYDVADRGPTSALSNCGYTPEEMAQTRLKWRDRINQWGLLDNLDDAVTFRAFSDERVSEHALFYIYEILRIP